MDTTRPLSQRLLRIWEHPNFEEFFSKYSKRPILKIRKGATIFYEGDEPNKIYFVKKGFVKLYRVGKNGRDSVLYLYGPGGILGIRALTSKDEILKHSADALTDVEIITLSRDDYFKIVSENPEYLVDLLHLFIQRLNYTERKLEGFVVKDTTARVAYFLLDCALRFGEKKGPTTVLPVPLTHQRVAEFVGAFRETATVALNKLIDDKVITSERGIITILSMQKLEKIAAIEDGL